MTTHGPGRVPGVRRLTDAIDRLDARDGAQETRTGREGSGMGVEALEPSAWPEKMTRGGLLHYAESHQAGDHPPMTAVVETLGMALAVSLGLLLGGALGALGRHEVTTRVRRRGATTAGATMLVNLPGSLLLGLVAGIVASSAGITRPSMVVSAVLVVPIRASSPSAYPAGITARVVGRSG